MLLVAFLITLTICDVCSAENGDLSNRRDLLTIYTLTSERVCSPEMMLFNFTHSVAAAVRYAHSVMSENNETLFGAVRKHEWVPGCSMQEASRASKMHRLLQNLQKTASNSTGFSVLLGPPLASDCNLVNEWINLGDPNATQRVQLYQISYYCHIFSSYSTFSNRLANNSCHSPTPPVAAVSVTVQHRAILQGMIAYLLNKGWKRIALFYDMRATNFGIPEMLATTPLLLPLSRSRKKVLHLLTSEGITSSTNFPSLLEPIEDYLDAALILARPSLAVEFVLSIQNLTKIKQGRIALIQVDPTDMLTYDSLRVWRYLLSKTAPTMAAGRSLIILTALPKGTVYNEDSVTYKEQINLSVASAAALAMHLVQMHLQEGGGNIGSSSNLFLPLSTLAHTHIPTLPSITFHYQTHNGDISQGIFDLFLFSLKPNLTESADIVNKFGRYAETFNLIDIIHYPQLLPQRRGRMDWPGDGWGPQRAYCLVATCEFDLIKDILLINLLGVINAGLIYLCILLINRGIICKKKRPISIKLVFLENEFVFEDKDGKVAVESSNTSRRNTQSQADMVPNLDALTSFHALISTAQVPLAASSLNEEALPSVKKRSIAWLNGVQVYVKQLGLPRVVLRSKLIEYLAGLREIRHENINAFMGCCVASDSFSLVFEYCHRGCLQETRRKLGFSAL